MPLQELTITNRKGLHARAATSLAKEANNFQADITLHCNGKYANAKSVMSVMLLAASVNTPVTLETSGADEQQALAALSQLIAKGFYEED